MTTEKEKQKYHGFGNNYAELYDKFYQDKDYDGEVGMLEDIFKRHDCNPEDGAKVLDIGCGTGNHAIRMAKRGYDVTGVDPSRRMLQIAREKAIKDDVKLNLKERGLPNLNLDTKYKGIECMFNVLNHVLEDDKILDSFKNIYERLEDDGVFVFDFRNAIPSLNEYSPKRILHIRERDADFFRVSNSVIDKETRIFTTQYECFVIKHSRCGKFYDEHKVRAFYFGEVDNFLLQSGFKLKELFPFGKPGQKVNECEDWNIVGVCGK